MDAIKKKMQSLKSETDNALTKAEELDIKAKEETQRAEKLEENVRLVFENLKKKIDFFFNLGQRFTEENATCGK